MRPLALLLVGVLDRELLGGRWRSEPFDCTDDLCSCAAVCCCWPLTTGQLFQKTTRLSNSCCCISIIILLLFALQHALTYETWFGLGYPHPWHQLTQRKPEILSLAAAAVGALLWVMMCVVVCIARAAARKRDEIPEERCLGCEDVCCSWFCWYCTSMQLMRHEGLTAVGGRYRLLSATGEAHV